MNITGIFLNNELRTGGHKRYLELMEGLASKGHRVTVYLNAGLAWQPASFVPVRVEAPYVRGTVPFLGGFFRSSLYRFLKIEPAPPDDWILVFGETHWPSARLLASRTGAGILFAYRSDTVKENLLYLEFDHPGIKRRLSLRFRIAVDRFRERMISRSATVIAFQSPADRDRFVARNRRAAGKTAVIRGDIRQKRFTAELALANASTRCRKLLFVGTLGRRKGLEYLLRALAELPRELSQTLTLDILAAGTDWPFFEKIVAENGLSGMVRFHGKAESPLPFMVGADLLVVPSLFDSYPNVVLEALHVGLPVVGTNTGGIPDMLADPSLLFEPASASALASVLARLASSDEAYAKARALCLARRAYFDFDWAEEWEKVLTETR